MYNAKKYVYKCMCGYTSYIKDRFCFVSKNRGKVDKDNCLERMERKQYWEKLDCRNIKPFKMNVTW